MLYLSISNEGLVVRAFYSALLVQLDILCRPFKIVGLLVGLLPLSPMLKGDVASVSCLNVYRLKGTTWRVTTGLCILPMLCFLYARDPGMFMTGVAVFGCSISSGLSMKS